MEKKLATALGRAYTIVKKLGAGGMAEVFLAREEPTGPLVAVKILPPDGYARPETLERFRREAVTAGRLRHRNIVPIRDLSLEHQPPFFIMDFAPGGSLADRIRKHRNGMPEDEILAIARQILLALDHAHKQRVIHRDIKPENVLFDAGGHVLVSDFGLARLLDEKSLTHHGALLGTPYYNSPELARGLKVYDGRCDLYSLGVILYEMATGEVPFDGVDAVSVCHRHVFEPPRPPRALRSNLGLPLEKLILKALEKRPGDRYQSAEDMLADLELVEHGLDLAYDPLPGVISLLNDAPDGEPGFSAFRRRGSSGAFGRFLAGSADKTPEPGAGLLMGLALVLIVWLGLAEFRSDGRAAEATALQTRGVAAEAADAELGRVVVFPMEDRSGRADVVRQAEEGVALALEGRCAGAVPARAVADWQRQKGLAFSALFSEKRLSELGGAFGATHFATGVVLEVLGAAGRAPASVEVELSLHRFSDRARVATWRAVLKPGNGSRAVPDAVSSWVRAGLTGEAARS